MITDTEHAKEDLTQVRDSVQPRAIWWRERNAIYYNKACLPDRFREMLEDIHLPKEERMNKLKQQQIHQQQVRRNLEARKSKRSGDKSDSTNPSTISDIKLPERFDIYHHPVIRPVLLCAINELGLSSEGTYKIPFILPLGSRQCPFITDDWSSTLQVQVHSFTPESISELKK
jgi:hypothetical protein